MYRTKKVSCEEQHDQIVDLLCNVCGESQKFDSPLGTSYYHDAVHIDYRMGYFSRVYGDDTQISCEICEKCFQAFAATFKIPLTIS